MKKKEEREEDFSGESYDQDLYGYLQTNYLIRKERQWHQEQMQLTKQLHEKEIEVKDKDKDIKVKDAEHKSEKKLLKLYAKLSYIEKRTDEEIADLLDMSLDELYKIIK